jgi:hypothetical protein
MAQVFKQRRTPHQGADRRRSLSFADLSQIVPNVQRIRGADRTVGRWTLGQICTHLANSFHGSIDGLDLSRHRFKRFFFSRQLLRYTFRYGIPASYRVDPGIEPQSDVDPDEAIEELTRAIERYRNHHGPLEAHPLFGKMPREAWDRVHCIHCAHHLSFVVPTEG